MHKLKNDKIQVNNLTQIEVYWDGPFTTNNISKLNSSKDYGLYQIYGTHIVYGSDSLLYLGQANDQTFAKRLYQHKEWLEWQSSEVQIYIGRLGGVKKINRIEKTDLINKAERILLYYVAPAYNTQNLNDYGKIKDTLVFNFGKRNRIPMEVSTLYIDSEFWNELGDWEEFTI